MTPYQFWCIGRNYADHARELGNPVPEKPLIFLKSGKSVQHGSVISFPPFCHEVHHELEVVVMLGQELKPTYWTLGLDLTERRIQNELKSLGQPWELSKTFKGATVLGAWQPITSLESLANMEFTLEINGIIKQRAHMSQMLFSIPSLIQYLDRHFPIGEGDAIFTGTPKGVGPIKSGDHLVAKSTLGYSIEWRVL